LISYGLSSTIRHTFTYNKSHEQNHVIVEVNCCRGSFFLSTVDQVQNFRRFALRAQNPLGPVICGNKKVKRNGFQPSIRPKAQKENPAHSTPKFMSATMAPEHLK
jgi:hypothetical protein